MKFIIPVLQILQKIQELMHQRGNFRFVDSQMLQHKTLKINFATHEKDKKRSYNQRVIQTENGSSTPLVFACTGRMSRESGKFYSRLASSLALKRTWKKYSYGLEVSKIVVQIIKLRKYLLKRFQSKEH